MESVPYPRQSLSVALLEVRQLSTAMIVADVCAEAANVRIVGVQGNAKGGMAIELVGPRGDVEACFVAGRNAAESMHAFYHARFFQFGHVRLLSPYTPSDRSGVSPSRSLTASRYSSPLTSVTQLSRRSGGAAASSMRASSRV